MKQPQLDSKYNWDNLESRWYKYWLQKKYFQADEDSSKEAYTIVIPPPNVTGKLTMGHVLNLSLIHI